MKQRQHGFYQASILTLLAMPLCANYSLSADSLAYKSDVNAYQPSVNYNVRQHFVRSEYAYFTSLIVLYPHISSYYVSYGYIIYPTGLHLIYTNTNSQVDQATITIPMGLNSTVNVLKLGYKQVCDSLTLDDLDSQAGQDSYFAIHRPDAFDYQADRIQVAMEWVF